MLSVNGLDIRFGDKHLFKDISVQVYKGNRIGLVGVNGAGKTTLLKIMASLHDCDDTVLAKAKSCTVGYLAQEMAELVSKRTLYEEVELAFSPLLELAAKLEEINKTIRNTPSSSKALPDLVKEQGELQDLVDAGGIYTIEGRIQKVLLGLGFSQEDFSKSVTQFSGGWQMRVKLAKMLLEEPLLLLLDEPTNHLDLESLTWVESFLIKYSGAMVIISHDRAFLDKVTTMTWELSFGNIHTYKGNYSYYCKEKEERQAIEQSAYNNQQAKIKQTMRFVERFRAKATKAKQVQSRVKQLEKMDIIELGQEEYRISFSFPPAPHSGRDVLQTVNVNKEFSGKEVFSNVDLLLNRGDKVAVVGVNGAGKSTLLKMLSGEQKCSSGFITYGTNVITSYFGQHQAQELSPELTVLETVTYSGEEMTVTAVRSLLGAFLFRGDDVEKKVSVLSGGEKSRLALAKMISTPANCMLLDEPTNHLDIHSQEVLQEAMAQYDGTIVVVSHNRYFVDSFINKVLEVKDGTVTLYEGNVSEYLIKQQEKLEQLQPNKQISKKPAQKSGSTSGENRKDKKRREAQLRQERSRLAGPWLEKLKKAEEQVELFEEQVEQLESKMGDPALYNNKEEWAEVSHDYETCKRRLERCYSRWEEAQEKIDEIDQKLASHI